MKHLAFLIRQAFPGLHYHLTEEITSNEACEPELEYHLHIEGVASSSFPTFNKLEKFINKLIEEKIV